MLKTEMRNPDTMHIDTMSTDDMMAVMQKANLEAAMSVGAVTAEIGRAVDEIAARMRRGGRLFYTGCGTSGRLGVVDAAECPPTYGVPPELVVGIIGGGYDAMFRAFEGGEDFAEQGRADLLAHKPGESDTVVGISAAGGAAYVLGAIRAAGERGALTVGITSNGDSALAQAVEIAICPDTGPEIVTGSTRMKAGTVQKMILNMISTGVMIRQGYVYENMMVNLRPTNRKLRLRARGITSAILGCGEEEAEQYLEQDGWSIRAAVTRWKAEHAETSDD